MQFDDIVTLCRVLEGFGESREDGKNGRFIAPFLPGSDAMLRRTNLVESRDFEAGVDAEGYRCLFMRQDGIGKLYNAILLKCSSTRGGSGPETLESALAYFSAHAGGQTVRDLALRNLFEDVAHLCALHATFNLSRAKQDQSLERGYTMDLIRKNVDALRDLGAVLPEEFTFPENQSGPMRFMFPERVFFRLKNKLQEAIDAKMERAEQIFAAAQQVQKVDA